MENSSSSFDAIPLNDAGKSKRFDLIVIGSGPAGQKAAITAAKEGARVAMVERDPLAGGVALNTGTIPSKSLREAVLFLTGYRQRGYYGEDFRLKEKVSPEDLLARTSHVIRLEHRTVSEGLELNGVQRFVGTGRIEGPHDVSIRSAGGTLGIEGEHILVAVGTRPRRPGDVPFDFMNVFDSDTVFGSDNKLRPLPDTIIVLGAGVIGIEYASMFGALGIPTILVDPRENPLGFVDSDLAEILYGSLRRNGIDLAFGTSYSKIEILGPAGDPTARVGIDLENGRRIEADACLFAMGRVPVVENLGLKELGVEFDHRNHVIVDKEHRTSVPSILAAGDVIGFPSLASTSAEQGRVAALNALGIPATWNPEVIPYGIYTIPEISMAGQQEADLIKAGERYFIGTALWRETARGAILGEWCGAMKLLFRRSDNRLVGVHIIGEGATELLHIGQSVMHFGGGPEYFLNTVFNYPTLAEAYKRAAHNAVNRLYGRAHHTAPLREQVSAELEPRNFIDWPDAIVTV